MNLMSDMRGRQLHRSSDASQGSSIGQARSHFSPSPPREEDKGRRRAKSRHRKEKNQSTDTVGSEKEYVGILKKFLNIKIIKETAAAAERQERQEREEREAREERGAQEERETQEARGVTEERQNYQSRPATRDQEEPEHTLEEMLMGTRMPVGARMPPIAPCPFIRPLTHKMVAREEGSLRAYRIQQRKASTASSSCSSFRSVGRPGSSETSRFSDERIQQRQFQTPSSSGSTESIEGRELQVHVPNKPATEKYSVDRWNNYIGCYQEGRYNMSKPPSPPPLPPDFKYLIAPKPCDEARRDIIAQKYNLACSSPTHDGLERLTHITRKLCQARMCTVSILSGEGEYFKATDGMELEVIERSTGFSAHTILSHEVMVVLDTQKDWRFQGNPFVTGEHGIRFAAGAPIITEEGYAIGILTIFDTEPRDLFPPGHHRKLTEMARLAMTELEITLDEFQSCRVSSVPSLTTSDSTFSTSSSRSSDDRDSARSCKSRAKLLCVLEEEAERVDRSSKLTSSTVDTRSSPASTPDIWLNPKSRRSSPPVAKVSHPKQQLQLVTTSSQPPTVPFIQEHSNVIHGNTIEEVPTPPQTPSETNEDSTGINETMLQIPAAATYAISPTSPTFIVTPTEVPDFSDEDHFGYATPDSGFGPLLLPEGPKKVNLAQFPAVPKKNSFTRETALAVEEIAQELHYDLVYALRVKPIHPNLPEDQLLPDGLETRIIASFGLPDPSPGFEPALHLRALRNEGGIVYQNPRKYDESLMYTDEDSGYFGGILIPLYRDIFAEDDEVALHDANFTGMHRALEAARVANKVCRAGVVLAAFKFDDNDGPFDNQRASLLKEHGEDLQKLLLESYSRWA